MKNNIIAVAAGIILMLFLNACGGNNSKEKSSDTMDTSKHSMETMMHDSSMKNMDMKGMKMDSMKMNKDNMKH
ncbi:MAG: hypothetical protein J0I09_02920 [Sphingobacteriia bacterium]|nr:hypothetical protein [Sphingobacteriia bacterium]